MRVNEIAAEIHRRMCEDDRFGYSWEERYGAYWETWWIDGKDYPIKVGDYDCSSSTITAWRTALMHTEYEGALDGATYTGNMSDVFCGSGLFERKSLDFLADTGDLYLNDVNHVAMCQTQYPDVLSEFSWGDNGAYGNQRGDQSGWEASVHGYYDYPWDCILHYNGRADGSEPEPIADVPMPRYRTAYIEGEEKKWYPWMEGLTDTGPDGEDYAGTEGVPIVDIEFENLGDGGWFSLNVQGIGELGRNVQNSTDNPIIGVTVYYDTPEPGKTGYYAAKYQVHWMGDGASWGKWELDDDDGGAGNDADPIDMFRLTLEKL